MGLGFTAKGYKDGPHFSYSGFAHFRKKLASAIGIDLECMQGFGKRHPVDEGYFKQGYLSWEDVQSPLKCLLNSRNDRGNLTKDKCAEILPSLKAILFLWEPSEDKTDLEHFIKIIEHCSEKSVSLKWS